MYNLIEERWIPVKRESGTVERIAPWEITDGSDLPLEVCFERPDFNSAVTQFLIAMCQTVYCPNDEDEWLDRLESPPTPSDLRELMDSVSNAFELLNEQHCYMQDGSIDKSPDKNINGLLITNPGENTVKNGKDFFIKYEENGCLCPSCTSAALTTLQMLAPMGGSGIRSSCRGSSAISAIVRGTTLWQTIYLNVLTSKHILRTGGMDMKKCPFPWMQDNNSRSIHPQDNSPLAIIWSMVRRVNLGETSPGVCDICGLSCGCLRLFKEVNKGNEYISWIHPLAPTYMKKDGETLHKLLSRDMNHFYQWSALAYGGQTEARPSLNVEQINSNRGDVRNILESDCRLWISGYQNKQALSESWIDVTVPMYLRYGDRMIFETYVKKLIAISKKAENSLISTLKDAMDEKGRNGGSKQSKINKNAVDSLFWSECDPLFVQAISDYSEESFQESIESWIANSRNVALRTFDVFTDLQPMDDYGSVVIAKEKLKKLTSKKSMTKELNKI